MTEFADFDEFRKALDRLNEATQRLLDVTLAKERELEERDRLRAKQNSARKGRSTRGKK